MSKQSAITHSKSSKETQEEAVKQAQSQQLQTPEGYSRHYSVATTINAVPNSHSAAVSTF